MAETVKDKPFDPRREAITLAITSPCHNAPLYVDVDPHDGSVESISCDALLCYNSWSRNGEPLPPSDPIVW